MNMIYFLRGTVHSFGMDYLILDCNGIGYHVNFCQQGQVSLGQTVTVYTYQQFREDAQLLFGFLEVKELDLFEKLVSVKGLGPKTAMTMLASANYDSLVSAIENGEVDFLTRIPSLGAKTSKQIILDLKGKLVEDVNNVGEGKLSKNLDEALTGLKNLGYKAYEINSVAGELKKMGSLSTDDYLKEGLRLLLQRKGG